jgi:hypothetical protein
MDLGGTLTGNADYIAFHPTAFHPIFPKRRQSGDIVAPRIKLRDPMTLIDIIHKNAKARASVRDVGRMGGYERRVASYPHIAPIF